MARSNWCCAGVSPAAVACCSLQRRKRRSPVRSSSRCSKSDWSSVISHDDIHGAGPQVEGDRARSAGQSAGAEQLARCDPGICRINDPLGADDGGAAIGHRLAVARIGGIEDDAAGMWTQTDVPGASPGCRVVHRWVHENLLSYKRYRTTISLYDKLPPRAVPASQPALALPKAGPGN